MNVTMTGEGPVEYVFLHGLFGQGRNWTSIARKLGSCLLPDLPNHGRSEWTDRFSYEQMTRAVIELLEGLPAPVVLVGHSMGGRVAMLVALWRPDLVKRLVVEDTVPAWTPMNDLAVFADAMASVPLAGINKRDEAREKLRGKVRDERILAFLLQSLQPDDSGNWRWLFNLDVLRRDIALVGSWPAVSATYPGPVKWITGGQSTHTTPAQAQAMTTLFPRTEHVVIENAGHWVHADTPDEFLSELALTT